MSLKKSLMKPFLKWAGGKRQLIPEISKHIPKFERYIEPFVGAGAVLFHLQPHEAVVSDFNKQLVQTYTAIRDNVEEVIRRLGIHKSRYNEAYYYQIRSMDRETASFDNLNPFDIAARFIFLNKTCYNGLYRVNSRGLFNVPFGKYKKPLINEEATLRAVSHYLVQANVRILHSDFEETASLAQKEDFVYFDPPYHSLNSTNFTGYQAGGFSETEQVRLCTCFKRLSGQGIKCLLSNSDTALIRELYQDFPCMTVPAKRLINTNARGRGFVNELLIKSW